MNAINNIDPQLLFQLGFTLSLVIIFFIVRKILVNIVKKHAFKLTFSESRMTYVIKLTNFGLSLLFIILIGFVWELSLKGLSFYFASIFTVVGVAFFASWSILSNVTAYAIIFFYFPFRIGYKIRIVDGDNSIEGTITDITIFFIQIELSDGEAITYPNNLAIQKPIKTLTK